MPLVDLPLDELRTYAGRNPKPADHAAFWDSGLEELSSFDHQVEIVDSWFQPANVRCADLWFTGTGNSRIHAKLLIPRHLSGPAPALCHFHGYSMRADDWMGYMAYAGAGFVVAALDCRGQAGQSQDGVSVKGPTLDGHIIRGLDDEPSKMYYRNVFLDTALLARLVMNLPEVDPARVGAYGGSQGGALALACASLEPRVARVAPVHPFLSDYQRVWEMDQDVAAYAELRRFFRQFDPQHKREAEIFERLGYIDVQHLTDRIQGEVLMGIGLMDTITPPSTCYAAYNKIQSPKREVVYPDFGHEGLPEFGDYAFEFFSQM